MSKNARRFHKEITPEIEREEIKSKRRKKYEEVEGSKGVLKPIQLDEEQQKVYHLIESKTIILLLGAPGTGKTFLGSYYALDKLLKDEIEKVIITRPNYSESTIGFLPGLLEEKMTPLLMPILSNMYRCLDRTKVDYYVNKKIIEMVPQEYMRGITINNGVMIVDELQNLTDKELKTIVTRVGKHSKLILCGDKRQCDLKNPKYSGLEKLTRFVDKDFGMFELTINHRHPIVNRIVEFYDSFDDKKD